METATCRCSSMFDSKGFDSNGFDSKGFDSKGFDSKGFGGEGRCQASTGNGRGFTGVLTTIEVTVWP
jgi:hypothetical protein